MKFTIFYAWQSDRDKNLNKFLIMAAAEAAVKNIAADADVELESWPRLFGQNFHGDKWRPALVALSTVASAEGPFRP